MPRLARVDVGNEIYHVINRANGRLQIFDSPKDYQLFEQLLLDAQYLTDMRILAYVIMPNHFHLVLWPQEDGDLGRFMHRLTNTHTRKVHAENGTQGTGHLYQGRYKSFIVDTDTYLLTLIKYVERNPVRAKLIDRAEEWQWGSAWRRVKGSENQKKLISVSPTPFPHGYLNWVNAEEDREKLAEIRNSVNRGFPYGRDTWRNVMLDKFHLESTGRSPGRPKMN